MSEGEHGRAAPHVLGASSNASRRLRRGLVWWSSMHAERSATDHLPDIKVHVVVGLVGHVRAKLAADEAMPYTVVLHPHHTTVVTLE